MRPNSMWKSALSCMIFLCAATATAQTKTFTTNADFDSGSWSNVVHVPADQLVLGPTLVSLTHTVWTNNYIPGWVVRLDSYTGQQVGRYDAALLVVNSQSTGARPVGESCNMQNSGNCPGRVAVDSNGDVWIVNRAVGLQGTVTKISGDPSRCVDRDGNGVIDTSADKDNDGLIDPDPNKGEYLGQQDECILTTFPVGPVGAIPRGVAVDKNGKIWVSTFNDGKLYRYDPIGSPTLEMTVDLGGHPYSLATGGDYVFVSRNSGSSARVHILTGAVSNLSCPGTSYGIVGDPGGDVAWIGGYSGYGIYRLDFVAGTCTNTNNGVQVTAITLDRQPAPGPYVWSADYSSNTVSKFTTDGMLVGTYPAGGNAPHGLSVDFQGNLWVASDGAPHMAKLDTITGAVLATYDIGGPAIPNAMPYLYSDFTGVQIDRQAPYTYTGGWEGTFDGQAPGIPWSKVTWNSEAQGSVPGNSSLLVSARAADSVQALAAATYVTTTNGGALTSVVGRYVQVRADFKGPGWETPVLSDITVVGPCTVTGDSCCLQDTDCDDTDPCTTDVCTTLGGVCSHASNNDCCNVDADCADDDFCTADICSGSCFHPPIEGCCHADADCGSTGVCVAKRCEDRPYIAGSGLRCAAGPLARGTGMAAFTALLGAMIAWGLRRRGS